MNRISIIGLVAGSLTTFAQAPQAYKIWKLKETRDISLTTYVAIDIGTILWFIYGISINDAPLYIFNFIGFCICFIITILKLKYG